MDRSATSIASPILRGVLFVAALSYAKDVYDVYNIISATNCVLDSRKVDDDYMHELLAQYENPQLIQKDEFRRVLQDLETELKQYEESGLFEGAEDPALRIFRELTGGVTGTRAVALQIAHPYIAKGVLMHSNVLTNPLDRAMKTQKFTFGMLFGSREEIMSYSNQVRHLHNKVKGEIGEQIGIFSASSPFDASQRDAVIWVAATMPDSVKLGYELLVRPLTQEEKEAIIRVNQRFMKCFGVLAPYRNWQEYEKYYYTMLKADKLLVPSEACHDLITGLSIPRHPWLAPLTSYLRWIAYVQVPNHLSEQLYGRRFGRLDYFLFALIVGRFRFLYRLLPEWLRCVTPYHVMMRRIGKSNHWTVTEKIIDLVGDLAHTLLQNFFVTRSREEVDEQIQHQRSIRQMKINS